MENTQDLIKLAEKKSARIKAKLDMMFWKLTIARAIMKPEQIEKMEQELSDIQIAYSMTQRMIRVAKRGYGKVNVPC